MVACNSVEVYTMTAFKLLNLSFCLSGSAPSHFSPVCESSHISALPVPIAASVNVLNTVDQIFWIHSIAEKYRYNEELLS